MSSKREEERNEKIIRGLMKLPPNRRCINCNSLGPQYVCTNFWTFVCITCSGIHREFTHRVKSVSMAKFTSQEVDALQSGGNQRARELFLKDWDPQKNRLPDNSNIDKVREFIKKVYIDKLYFQEKLTDRPPRDPQRDPQSLRSHEDQTRRASSYHSYSQSPPYDFQYEERRYGKHGPVLTRKPGSDRGLYEGKLASFLSPTRLSDHANDERFANDPRFSDYSVSGGGDPFRSDALSPSSQRDTGSPFSESSRDISNEVPQLHKVLQGSDANNRSNGGKVLHQQIAGASGSFGSFDNNPMPCKPVNSLDKSSSLPSLPQSSVSMTFDELDLFSSPFPPQNGTSIRSTGTTQLPHPLSAPSLNVVRDKSSTFPSLPVDEFDFFSKPFTSQNVTSQSPSGGNTQLPSTLAQSLNVVHPLPISSGPTFTVQQPSQISQASPAGLFSVPSQQNNGGWAKFDMPQNVVSMGGEKSAPVEMLSSDGNVIGSFNPFSVDESSYYVASSGHEPYALPARAFGHEHLQNVETTINQTQSWSAFDDPAGGQPIQEVIRGDKQASVPYVSDANNFLGFGVYEGFNDGNATGTNESEPPLSSLHTNSRMMLNGFPMVSAVTGVHPLPTDHKPANPFDLPLDSDMESSNVFWNMSSLQAALPNTQTPPSYTVNQSWNFENSVPSYAPGGPFGPTSGSVAFMAGEASSTQVPSIHAQGPVASMGGNPFA